MLIFGPFSCKQPVYLSNALSFIIDFIYLTEIDTKEREGSRKDKKILDVFG